MAYTKQTWTTGDTITAEKLNHMEDGIAGGTAIVDGITGTLDKTWQEIFDMLKSGTIVFIKVSDDSESVEMHAVNTCAVLDNVHTVLSGDVKYVANSADGYPVMDL